MAIKMTLLPHRHRHRRHPRRPPVLVYAMKIQHSLVYRIVRVRHFNYVILRMVMIVTLCGILMCVCCCYRGDTEYD